MIEDAPGYDFKKDLLPDQLRQTFKLGKCLDEEQFHKAIGFARFILYDDDQASEEARTNFLE